MELNTLVPNPFEFFKYLEPFTSYRKDEIAWSLVNYFCVINCLNMDISSSKKYFPIELNTPSQNPLDFFLYLEPFKINRKADLPGHWLISFVLLLV